MEHIVRLSGAQSVLGSGVVDKSVGLRVPQVLDKLGKVHRQLNVVDLNADVLERDPDLLSLISVVD